jgi:hypothetical protein
MRQSDAVEKLAEALAAAQGEIVGAVKDKTNPHFRNQYADLSSIWDACRGPLSSHGLAVAQTTRADEKGGLVLVTTLLHASGQWISGDLPILGDCDSKTAQAIGSAITYGRRYGLAAMVGVCPEDDDGEAAVEQQRGQRANGRDRREPRGEARGRNGHEPERFPVREGPPAAVEAGSMTKLARRFESTLNGFCQRMNAAWTDKHTNEVGEIPAWVKDLANPYQIVGHMLKEAGVETPKGGNFGERMKAAAKLWEADEAGTEKSWKRYLHGLALAQQQEGAAADEGAEAVANGSRDGR